MPAIRLEHLKHKLPKIPPAFILKLKTGAVPITFKTSSDILFMDNATLFFRISEVLKYSVKGKSTVIYVIGIQPFFFTYS
jgi:hypothetical protein